MTSEIAPLPVGESERWILGSSLAVLFGLALFLAGAMLLRDSRSWGTTFARWRLYAMAAPWKRPEKPSPEAIRKDRVFSGWNLIGFGGVAILFGLISLLWGSAE
ncbi:MAG TPA: hypothetical protein VHG72_21055, partial [Polyangia bacterium]|nr:hypothetical protein [Polyangia bacterium]